MEPVILVTRKLPDAVEDRLRRDYEPMLNPDDDLYTSDEIIERAKTPDIHPEYRNLPNVFLMPHIGSATKETRDAMGFRALDNLDAIFSGKEPRDRVA